MENDDELPDDDDIESSNEEVETGKSSSLRNQIKMLASAMSQLALKEDENA